MVAADPSLVDGLRRHGQQPAELGNALTVDALIEAGRLDQAASVLRKLVASEPDRAGLHAKLAFCLLEREPDAALRAAQRAAALRPAWEWPHRLEAHAQLARRQPRLAVDAATRSVQRAPQLAEAHCVRAETLLAARRFRAADEAAATAVRLAPDDALGHTAAADVALARRHWRRAEASARQALALAPGDPAARAALAAAREGWGQPAEGGLALTRGLLLFLGVIAIVAARPLLQQLGPADLPPGVGVIALLSVVGIVVVAGWRERAGASALLQPVRLAVAVDRRQVGEVRPGFAVGLAGTALALLTLALL